jgi:hypothetical protein
MFKAVNKPRKLCGSNRFDAGLKHVGQRLAEWLWLSLNPGIFAVQRFTSYTHIVALAMLLESR